MGVCEIISACSDFLIDVLKDLLVVLGDFIAVSLAVRKKNWCFLLLIVRQLHQRRHVIVGGFFMGGSTGLRGLRLMVVWRSSSTRVRCSKGWDMIICYHRNK